MKPKENVSFRLKNIMPGPKKLWEEHLFPLEKLFFLPAVEKSNHFSSGNKSSPQSFSVPGIMFPARRNIYSSWLLKPNLIRQNHFKIDESIICSRNISGEVFSYLFFKVKTLWEGHLFWRLLSNVKMRGRFLQIFVAFSKNLNFIHLCFYELFSYFNSMNQFCIT